MRAARKGVAFLFFAEVRQGKRVETLLLPERVGN